MYESGLKLVFGTKKNYFLMVRTPLALSKWVRLHLTCGCQSFMEKLSSLYCKMIWTALVVEQPHRFCYSNENVFHLVTHKKQKSCELWSSGLSLPVIVLLKYERTSGQIFVMWFSIWNITCTYRWFLKCVLIVCSIH